MASRKNPTPWTSRRFGSEMQVKKPIVLSLASKKPSPSTAAVLKTWRRRKREAEPAVHAPEASARFQWLTPEFGPNRPFHVYAIHGPMELPSDGESSEFGSNTIFMEL